VRELARRIDSFQERVGRSVSWLMLGLVLLVFADLIFRYLFNRSFVFVPELEWHLFGLVYLLAAGYTMLHNEHVRVDILQLIGLALVIAFPEIVFALIRVFRS